MVISLQKTKNLLPLILLVVLSLGCSEKKEQEQTQTIPEPVAQNDTTYQEWQSITYKNITVKYPSDHEESSLMYDNAKKFEALIRTDCAFLNMPVPEESLSVFMFNAVSEGRKATGEMFPFYKGNSIYYWPPYTYGTALAKYLISKWAKSKTKFPFLNQGLMRLFDASGRNFHLMTLDYLDSNMFRSLHELALDSTINANIEKHRSVLAASFVDFVNYKYGKDHFAQLYNSTSDFDRSVKDIFQISTDSLEKEWINTIRTSFKR